MKVIEVKVKVGKTTCDKYCSYWSGSPGIHDCGGPIYETKYKCSECDLVFVSKPACKTHQTIKHSTPPATEERKV